MASLNLSAMEAEICSILQNQGSVYGWKLVSYSNKLKKHSIYTQLSRLEKKGFVEMHKTEPNEISPQYPRKYYRLTGLGEQVLSIWLAEKQSLKQSLGGVL